MEPKSDEEERGALRHGLRACDARSTRYSPFKGGVERCIEHVASDGFDMGIGARENRLAAWDRVVAVEG